MLVVVKVKLQAIKLNGNGLYDSLPVLYKAYCNVSAIWDNRWMPPAHLYRSCSMGEANLLKTFQSEGIY